MSGQVSDPYKVIQWGGVRFEKLTVAQVVKNFSAS